MEKRKIKACIKKAMEITSEFVEDYKLESPKTHEIILDNVLRHLLR